MNVDNFIEGFFTGTLRDHDRSVGIMIESPSEKVTNEIINCMRFFYPRLLFFCLLWVL